MKDSIQVFLKGWRKYVLGYVLLLLASHLVLGFIDQPIQQEEYSTEKTVRLQVVQPNGSLSDNEIEIDYQDRYTGSEQNPPTLLLLPGGIEGPEVFEEITDSLASHYRLIIPHLPGYNNGEKELGLPDYSFKALAIYTNQLLNNLQLSQLHVLGYGLGGASAIYLSKHYPGKVKSMSLISSIGVQELELLGSYRLNHAVHGMQLGAVWLLDNAVPHFGLLNLVGINVSYAKSHYESDQRPLRSYLKEFKKPMFILHGREDPLVPLAAANEHYRIVPQSSIKLFDADHDLIETHTDSVSSALMNFISSVESGSAATANDASAERIAQAEQPFSNVEFQRFKGVSLLIIMLIIVLSTFMSEDLTSIGAGLLAAKGLIGFWPAVAACFIGIFVGDVGLYFAGRILGRPAIRKAPFKWVVSERDLTKSADWFDARGPAIIIASRFLPGSRLPTYFTAGVIGASLWMFIGYFTLSAVIWTPLIVGISQILGNELIRFFSLYHNYAIWLVIGAVMLLVMLVKVIVPAFSYKGRRLLVSRYRRLTRWKYWSPFIFYIPVSCYILYLGFKHRCLTLFTATNPAIFDRGFIGESKTEILQQFDQNYIARHKFIGFNGDSEDMTEEVHAFMERHELSFPIVLKPDVGKRGKGVEVIRDRESISNFMADASKDIIVQQYLEGEEFGVFYFRVPHQSNGRIFSVSKKKLLSVEGDGKKTIEELILADDEAVSLAKVHLAQNEHHLYDVPKQGEKVSIVEVGTHARGAIFTDGEALITDALIEKINEISGSVPGFYFGQYDVKAPSQAKFKKGEGLQVIEVNGVSSESLIIYDSKYSFWEAQRILMKQWKVAFAIGKENIRKGTISVSTTTFLYRTFNALKKG